MNGCSICADPRKTRKVADLLARGVVEQVVADSVGRSKGTIQRHKKHMGDLPDVGPARTGGDQRQLPAADVADRLRALAGADAAGTFKLTTGLDPDWWQGEIFALPDTENVALLKSRQIGASLGIGAGLAADRMLKVPGFQVVVVSPNQKQSQEVARKVRYAFLEILPEGLRFDQKAASVIALPNGSRLVSLPGTADSVRGYTAHLLVMDEAAFILDETWVTAQATVAATRGRIIAQSTPSLSSGWFYELMTSGTPGWHRMTVPAPASNVLTEEWIAAQRATMRATFGSDGMFQREYMCEWDAAVLAGLPLFDEERLVAARSTDIEAIG